MADRVQPAPLAYGLSLSGPIVDEPLRALLLDGGDGWPAVRLDWRAGRQATEESLDEDSATLRCPFGGHLVTDRLAMSATFVGTSVPDHHVLAHPGITGIAVIFARWLGRTAFHGGAVLTTSGVWGIVAAKGKGKSTTLAALALRGYEVLADDLVVLDGNDALAGPRTLDLRPSAARNLPGPFTTVRVRGGERQRLLLGSTIASAPLRGWVHLEVGRQVDAVPIPPAERPAVLGRHLAVRLVPRDPTRFLEFSTLPAWRLRRPMTWGSLPETVKALEDVIGGPA